MTSTYFTNGTVRVPGKRLNAESLLVVDGLVAESTATPIPFDAQVIDLGGGLLMPSFGDGHLHPLLAAREGYGPRLRDASTVEEILERVKDWATNSQAPWLIGGSYDATIVPDGIFDARWLDEVVPDRPVVLHAWDYHTVWVNTPALLAAAIDRSTPDPDGGVIARRADGSPLGTLIERPAIDLVLSRAPVFDQDVEARALCDASRLLAAKGITWAQEAWTELSDVETWIAASWSGDLMVDFDLAFRADPRRWPHELSEISIAAKRLESTPNLTGRTIKFFVDGIIENRTAHLLHDYHDACTRGLPNWNPGELAAGIAAAYEAGFDVHLHTIGDGAVRSAVEALETLTAQDAGPRGRATIAHAQLVESSDFKRLGELGVTICFQPQWAMPDAVMLDLTLPRLGPSRELQYRMKSALDAGVSISFGSDWPVSEPDVLAGIRTAVTRQDADGSPAGGWQPGERITVDQALDAATTGVTRQAGLDYGPGILHPGAPADLVWLERDPRDVNPQDIGQIRILGTWRRGERTYSLDTK